VRKLQIKILLLALTLTISGAYLLRGQQAPSEEADWPWKAVTESLTFLNGAPVGRLGNTAPLVKKLGLNLDQARRAGKLDQYNEAPVFLALDPNLAILRIDQLAFAIIEGTGDPVFVRRSSLERAPEQPKPNPRAFIVSSENVDEGMIRNLANKSDEELSAAGNRIYFTDDGNDDRIRFARTYESSIEIGSDGKFYLNRRTGTRKAPGANLASRIANPMWETFNSNQPPRGNVQLPPAMPLKQQQLSTDELGSVVSELAGADPDDPSIFVIASEKARYQRILDIMEAVNNPNVTIVLTIRRVAQR
jgi:hypothetical protein